MKVKESISKAKAEASADVITSSLSQEFKVSFALNSIKEIIILCRKGI